MSVTSNRTVTLEVKLEIEDNGQFNSGYTVSLLNALILGQTDKRLFGDDSTKLIDSQAALVNID